MRGWISDVIVGSHECLDFVGIRLKRSHFKRVASFHSGIKSLSARRPLQPLGCSAESVLYACYPSFSSLRLLMPAFISSIGLVFVIPDDELFVLSSFITASCYDAITLKRDKLKVFFVKIYDRLMVRVSQ